MNRPIAEPWDDKRLAAAFSARASQHPTPTDLAGRTLSAVRFERTSRPAWLRVLAPAGVVVLVVGAVVVGSVLQRADIVAPASMSSPSEIASSTPIAASSDPVGVLGLPILSVVEALAIRDAGIDDQEIAVRGWHAPYYPARACGRATPEQPASPLQAGCSDRMRFLMQDPEAVITASAAGLSWRGPEGPAISPYLREVDLAWASSDDVERLVELVVIGHFDDRRSFACPATEVEACRDRLVVDRIVSVDGRDVGAIALDQTASRVASTAAEVESTVLRWTPRAEVLSMVAVDGEIGLQGVEPSIGVFARFQDQRAIWVVRALESGVLGTYLLVDGTDALFKIDGDNVATQVAGTLPVPSPVPWPPEGATVIELTSGEGREPARVAVVDLSGQLVEARAQTPEDGSAEGPGEGLFRDPTANHRYRLRWATTICDREVTVTIHPNVERIVIGHAPRDGCDAMGVGRELVLEFASDLDPADVTLEVLPAEILPEPPPEPTTMIVELIRGDAVEEIVVIDYAGSLMEARPADLADVPAEIRIAGGTRLARVDDGGTVVLWDGGLCDRDISITIEADALGPPDRITVRSVRSEPCRLALVHRAVWLDLGPVNVSSIVARHDVSVAPQP